MKKNVYSRSSLCCGCGACVAECPADAIHVTLDGGGFYTAKFDNEKCTSCGKCIKVCPFVNRKNIRELSSSTLYSYKASDNNIFMKSLSGGMGYVIAKDQLERGKSVIDCVYDKENHIAKHIVVSPDEAEKLSLTQGSKYMQSCFSEIMCSIRKTENGAVAFGTPCQVAGVRNLVGGSEKFLLVDLICHGVPTYNLYRKYLDFFGRCRRHRD